MKYTLSINQAAAIAASLPLSVCDLLIFDFIKDFFSSNYAKWLPGSDGKNYCYISHSLMCSQMPLLGMCERTIRRHCANLCACNVLVKDPNSAKPLYRQGEYFDLLIYFPDPSSAPRSTPPPHQNTRTTVSTNPDNSVQLSNISPNQTRSKLSTNPDNSVHKPGQNCPQTRTTVSTYKDIYIKKEDKREKKRNEVFDFFKGAGLTINPEEFYNYYEARAWMSGGVVIKDFRALARAWEARKTKNEIPRVAGQLGRSRKLKYFTYSDVCNEVCSRSHIQADFLRTSKICNGSHLYVLAVDYQLLSDEQKEDIQVLSKSYPVSK